MVSKDFDERTNQDFRHFKDLDSGAVAVLAVGHSNAANSFMGCLVQALQYSTSPTTYDMARCEIVASTIDDGVSAPVFTTQMSRCGKIGPDDEICFGQTAVTEDIEGAHAKLELDLVDGPKYRVDESYLSNRGATGYAKGR